MYKLGPIHQGAMERGAKTTSDSYILWPARVGAFSLVRAGTRIHKREHSGNQQSRLMMSHRKGSGKNGTCLTVLFLTITEKR